MINSNKLKGKLKEKGLTQKEAAKILHMGQSTFCQKINNKRTFSLVEAKSLSESLDCSKEEYFDIFFA